ncbi:MAG: O-antigen ligase family protein [Thermodesulfobacteriota bacterium]|nr:O-antigen ligase family protein [Thermodesulfobacteriota bacterium]
MTKPGLHFPIIAKLRLELIVAIYSIIAILLTAKKDTLLSARRSLTMRYMFFYLIVLLLSFIQAVDIKTSWDRMYIWILPNILLVILVLLYCTNRPQLNLFLWIFAILTAYLAYDPFYRFVLEGKAVSAYGIEYAVADKGIASGHVSLAHYLLQGMPFLWYLSLSLKNNWLKSAGLSLFVFCMIGVAISGSRGGMVGIVVMFLLISLFSQRRLLLFTLFALFLSAILIGMGDEYLNHMRSIFELGASDKSASSRIAGLISGIELMIKRPVLGVGPGCFPVARKAWLGWRLWAHNHYGELLGELGILGAVSWVLLAKQYILTTWEIRKSEYTELTLKAVATAIIVSTGIRLVVGMFDHSLHKFIWYMLAAVSVVLADLSPQMERSKTPHFSKTSS